ncbi:hypothetical protein B0H13DRAFT_1988956 [Mycena leptocephala]|nr:hypothetical protein B0H13DRAFT_1988956 [Mycena leptocephala]
MFRFSKRTFVTAVVLGYYAPGVLPLTITGPSSAQSNGTITITWTSVSTDPTTIEINIDENLNTFTSSDPFYNVLGITTADGSATFTLPALSVGTHRIALSSNDGFQVLAQANLEISAAASSVSGPSASGPSASGASASGASGTSSSAPVSSPPAPTSSSTSSTPSQSPTGPPNVIPRHHSNAAAIAGGVVGGVVVILLALLGWWYLRRRRSPGKEAHGDIIDPEPRFLAAPVGSAVAGTSAGHNRYGSRSEIDEFRPWEDNQTTATVMSSAPTLGSVSAPSASNPLTTSNPLHTSTSSTPSSRAPVASGKRRQPVVMRWEPPAAAPGVDAYAHAPQPAPDDGPSRDELLEEVQRLREHIDVISPPEYSPPQ